MASTQPEHRLGPALSLVGGAANFTIGEYVLVRIPDRIQVDGHFDEEATAGTALPLTSNGSSPQRFGFIRRANPIQDDIYELEVYPVLSFSRSGGALAGYNEMDDATKATLLPLPPLSRRQPTPEAFGDPIDFGNWTTYKDSWLSIVPRRFRMPTSRPLKRMIPPLIMPFSVLNQINLYRNTLRSNIPTADADFHPDHSQIPPNGWSGDEQGSSNPRQGRLGDAGGPTASGETSATSSPTLNGDDGGEKAAGEEQEQFAFKASHDLLVLEGVDEDAQGADSTMRDELIMMARDDPMWMAELRKYLQKEEKEREQVQKECAVRLARWREGIFVQPT